MLYHKKTKVKDLQAGQLVQDIFFVKFKKPIESYKNGYKFELKVGDDSGEIMLKYWGSPDENAVRTLFESLQPEDVIFVSGKVNVYNEKREVSLNAGQTITVLSPDEYEQGEFVKKSPYDIEVMSAELNQFIESITDVHIKKVLSLFFEDAGFVSAFKHAPAAMYLHHGWVGGLLEHVVSIVKLCDNICQTYPSLQRDLLICGAILHDIGKIQELKVTNHISVTEEGNLLGHLFMGASLVHEKIKNLDIPDEYKLKIVHMIVSHHGKFENGSPKMPAFPEALALAYIDEFDARLHMMMQAKESAQTHDDFVYTKEFGNVYLK